jgi:hypothetical protein
MAPLKLEEPNFRLRLLATRINHLCVSEPPGYVHAREQD